MTILDVFSKVGGIANLLFAMGAVIICSVVNTMSLKAKYIRSLFFIKGKKGQVEYRNVQFNLLDRFSEIKKKLCCSLT